MTIMDSLMDSGMKHISSNTAVFIKDEIEIKVSVSTIANIVNVIASVPYRSGDGTGNEMLEKINKLNDGLVFPLGIYRHNQETERLELMTNMIVDCTPTRKRLDEVIGILSASLLSAKNTLEKGTRTNE